MRALPALLIAAFLILVLGGLILFFSYGLDGTPPRHATVRGLEAPVRIGWEKQTGIAYIRADTQRDAFAALGFVHGARRAWTAALWRQTALGRLSEWFGQDVLPLDSLTRKLRFADLARQTYATLPEKQQALLEAYAHGLTAALQNESSLFGSADPFVLLGITPEAWAPWHTLAIERLFAWLSASPPAPEQLAGGGPAVSAFFEANRQLHRWLALHGFAHSLAFAVYDTTGTHFYQRQVYGASALPLYQEVVLRVGDKAPLLGASLPGTPFFPAGRTSTHAWSLLPSTAVTLERTAADTIDATRIYERLEEADGTEHLLAFRYLPGALPLGRPSASMPTGPTWTVYWSGFSTGTDLDAFLALLQGHTPPSSTPSASAPFVLLEGDGLSMDSTGAIAVLGDPRVVERFPAGVLVGNAWWARYAADQLRALANPDGRATIKRWVDRDSSVWAARTAPVLLASLDSLARLRGGILTSEQSTGIFNNALTYLRNWNFSYDRASIGASIYDTWVRTYHRAPLKLPRTPAADSASPAEWKRRYNALQRAVATLVEQYGRDLRTWRWETVMPDVRHFPAWTADSLLDAAQAAAHTRYAPVHLPGRGHPSSLSWGPSHLDDEPPAPAVWEAWIGTNQWKAFHVRRRHFQTGTFLGRYRAPHQRPAPFLLTPHPPTLPSSTLLTPPSS